MTSLVVLAVVLALFLLPLLLPRRRHLTRRTVLLHAPAAAAWTCLRDFPELLSLHGRGRSMGAFDRHRFIRGDGRVSGSIWRSEGRWGRSEHWLEGEIVRYVPERRISVRLLRDSLGTHRGLREHRGTLSLEPSGPDSSKLTWELRIRFRALGLLMSRCFGMRQLTARLLDLGLRSVKLSIDEAHRQQTTGHDSAADRPAVSNGQADESVTLPSQLGPLSDRYEESP